MKQSNIWMRFLVLGIIISLPLFINSCQKINYGQFAEFHFVNKTNHAITYNEGFEKYNVAAMSTTIVKESQSAGKNVTAEGYHRPFIDSRGSIILKFDQDKCIIDHPLDSPNSIINLKNYVAEKIGDRTYKFTYTFTEADYNRAVACP